MKSKLDNFRSFIRREIYEALNESLYDISNLPTQERKPFQDKTKLTDPKATYKLANEGSINEMASFYKIKDEEGFKRTLKALKDKVGDKIDKFNKTTLGKILNTLDKEGEVDYHELAKIIAKEKGKTKMDIASFNNPETRKYLENNKDDNEFNFTPYLQSGKKGGVLNPEDSEKPHTSEKPHKSEKNPKPHTSTKSEEKPENDYEMTDNDPIIKMANLEKERKEINNKYKAAEGEEKAKLLQQLKSKTNEIKKLDKIIRDLEGDEDEY